MKYRKRPWFGQSWRSLWFKISSIGQHSDNRCQGRASGSRHVKPVDPEQEEERLRAKRMATKARRDERVGRWARALVETLGVV